MKEGEEKFLDLVQKIKKFSWLHCKIQLRYNLKPDWIFPTYVLTQKQLDDVSQGRAFVPGKDNLRLKTFSTKDWYNDLESDYRVMLFQLISHDFGIFYGNRKSLEHDSRKALHLILLYSYELFGYSNMKFISLDNILKALFFSAGLDYEVSPKIKKIFLEVLKEHSLGKIVGTNLFLNHKTFAVQIKKLINLLSSTNYMGHHLVLWDDMSQFVSGISDTHSLIERFYDWKLKAKSRQDEWESWHERTKEEIKRIKNKELETIRIGGNVTYKPGVRLIKSVADPKIYAIEKGGVLRWIASEEIVKVLYGKGWQTMVDVLPDPYLVNYSMGSDIKALVDHDPKKQMESVSELDIGSLS